MTDLSKIGYAGRMLRVDLGTLNTKSEALDEGQVCKWVGGVGLGANIYMRKCRRELNGRIRKTG